jgi:ankyrin repeat protein
MANAGEDGRPSVLAESAAEVQALHQQCRQGRLYDVERWLAAGKPLQLAPEAIAKGTRPKTALQIALETGQHSLASLLLKSGYRLELERYAPLDLALRSRRWDLFDLLLEWGGDLKSIDVYTVLDTYNAELYERFRAAGYDLTERHEMASILGHGTRNRPLLGFVKGHRSEDPKIQQELNIALGYHVRAGNERGINLCLWAGADPHAPAPNPALGISEDPEPEDGEERFIGWSAIEEAASHGHLTILKRLGPDPARDDFDSLYQWTRSEFIVAFLATMRGPRDLTRILASQLWWLGDRFPSAGYRSTRTIEAVLSCGGRWEETDPGKLTGIRRSLLNVANDHLKTIAVRLGRPEICAPETYHELLRTPRMQERLRALGLVKKPVTEREKQQRERERRAEQAARLMREYDRGALYDQVWSRPVQDVAKGYGISGVRLGKICRALNIPVPPRGYWARGRSGAAVRKPALPKLE